MSACNGFATVELVQSLVVGGGATGFTPEGGMYITLINDTGVTSVKGTIVIASITLDKAVRVAPSNSDSPIGIIYEDGIANGQLVKIVVCGNAEVLLKNTVSGIRGYWVGVSNVAGRAYQEINPPSTTEHNRELGHCLENKAAGTNILCLINLHWN